MVVGNLITVLIKIITVTSRETRMRGAWFIHLSQQWHRDACICVPNISSCDWTLVSSERDLCKIPMANNIFLGYLTVARESQITTLESPIKEYYDSISNWNKKNIINANKTVILILRIFGFLFFIFNSLELLANISWTLEFLVKESEFY